jgi:hypothetical protein
MNNQKNTNRRVAQSTCKPATNAGWALNKAQEKELAVLTERSRIHVRNATDALDVIMDQPFLDDRIQKQLFVAWYMIEHASLPYFDAVDPSIPETILDAIIELLTRRRADEAFRDNNETAVLPQPLSPESFATKPPVPEGHKLKPKKSGKRIPSPQMDDM